MDSLTPVVALHSHDKIVIRHKAFVIGLPRNVVLGFSAVTRHIKSDALKLLAWLACTVVLGAALATSAGAGVLAVLQGRPFLTGLWAKSGGADGLSLGTPLLFDLGVYLTVMGVVLSILVALMEETR